MIEKYVNLAEPISVKFMEVMFYISLHTLTFSFSNMND